MWGYDELIEERGVKIIAQASDEDYHGDTLMLVQGPQGFGLLIFGWGSCSGCDAYEAAYGNEKELAELGDQLISGIQWFDTLEAAEDYIVNGKDWEGTWVRQDTVERFKTEVVTL